MKKIFGFQVFINDIRICRAGFENKNSIVYCILNSIRREKDDSEELNISIGGLNSDKGQHADWYTHGLKEGDKITVEIISNDFDTPVSMGKPYSNKEIITQKLEAYYQLKEELKEYLKE